VANPQIPAAASVCLGGGQHEDNARDRWRVGQWACGGIRVAGQQLPRVRPRMVAATREEDDMIALCQLGFHSWDYCKCSRCGRWRDEEHNWNGCKCASCSKTRNDNHPWQGCKCMVCGQTRDDDHAWKGCKCATCGKKRDEDHRWMLCRCQRCGKEKHEWQGCICKACGETRYGIEGHQWEGTTCKVCGRNAWDMVGASPNRDSLKSKGGRSGTCSKCGKRSETVMVFGSVGPDILGRRELCGECLAAAAASGRIG
jgi:hypothetical protein